MNYRTALSLLFLSFGLFAQNAPKVEIFGGYSYFGLGSTTAGVTNFGFDAANLNGWNAAAKFNLTPRIGLVADFSGHYGYRDLQMPIGANPALQPKPADMRQHTFLVGPEARLVLEKRFAVNVRALAGVASRNTLIARLAQPIEPTPPLIGNPAAPVTQLSFSGGNGFAASFGGSFDYRISDRLSYRLVQPELLLTRFGGSTQADVRVSTGIVFAFGR